MNNSIRLSITQIEEIKRLANDTRRNFGIVADIPIAHNIFMLLDKMGIILCQYPFESTEDSNTDATITWFETEGEPLTFIGLNSAIYFDKQIFALAHELYHYITKTGKAYNLKADEEDQLTEKKADRFAAELLLPNSALESLVVDEFGCKSLKDIILQRIVRFLARLQCEWWLPYRSLVKRLHEEGYLNQEQYGILYKINDRDETSDYARICKELVDDEKYQLLNSRTNKKSISNKVLETIIQNYEDAIIDADDFVNILSIFDKSPSDFGFDLSVSEEDLKELEYLYGGGNPHES